MEAGHTVAVVLSAALTLPSLHAPVLRIANGFFALLPNRTFKLLVFSCVSTSDSAHRWKSHPPTNFVAVPSAVRCAGASGDDFGRRLVFFDVRFHC